MEVLPRPWRPSMHAHRRFIAGALASLAVIGPAVSASAQDTFAAPTYQRVRSGAEDWQARGGFAYGGGHSGFGWPGGFFQPYVSPVIASSWYARPYPYHFDYFRGRWDGGQSGYVGEAAPAPDCPCANEVPPVTGP